MVVVPSNALAGAIVDERCVPSGAVIVRPTPFPSASCTVLIAISAVPSEAYQTLLPLPSETTEVFEALSYDVPLAERSTAVMWRRGRFSGATLLLTTR